MAGEMSPASREICTTDTRIERGLSNQDRFYDFSSNGCTLDGRVDNSHRPEDSTRVCT